MPPVVCILGRFPPPIDGQSMLTEQMARQLEDRWKVQRINTAVQTETHTRTDTGWNSGVAKHYLRLTRHTRAALAAEPNAPVIWHSISPMPLGHFRDLLTIIPAFQSTQKVYAVIHWGNFDRLFRSRLTRFTAKRLVRRLSGFVFLDDCLSKNCEAWIPPEKRFTIPNNIDDATRCTPEEIADKQSRRVKRESLRLLFLSNMIPSKGYLDVLHAVKILHAEGLPLHADFIGRWQSDEDQKSFMDYVAEHKLENVITAHGGIQDRARIKQFYLNADVFLLPTYYPTEAQPLSILEAINAGTPVVTTQHASIPYMVREHAQEALFVPARSPESIATALRKLADVDTWLTFSKSAALRFANHFSPVAVREKWESLLTHQ